MWQSLATPHSVTIVVPPSGVIKVVISAGIYGDTSNKYMSVALSGANTFASPPTANNADTARYTLRNSANVVATQSKEIYFTGLNPGSTTVTAQHIGTANTSHFFSRSLIVEPKF